MNASATGPKSLCVVDPQLRSVTTAIDDVDDDRRCRRRTFSDMAHRSFGAATLAVQPAAPPVFSGMLRRRGWARTVLTCTASLSSNTTSGMQKGKLTQLIWFFFLLNG
jgi:hypothetical protein